MDAEWQTLIDGLNELAGDPSKIKEGEKHKNKLLDATQRMEALRTKVNRSNDPAQGQLSRFEENLDNLAVGHGSMNRTQLGIRGGSMNQTWAGVAAQGIRQAIAPLSPWVVYINDGQFLAFQLHVY